MKEGQGQHRSERFVNTQSMEHEAVSDLYQSRDWQTFPMRFDIYDWEWQLSRCFHHITAMLSRVIRC